MYYTSLSCDKFATSYIFHKPCPCIYKVTFGTYDFTANPHNYILIESCFDRICKMFYRVPVMNFSNVGAPSKCHSLIDSPWRVMPGNLLSGLEGIRIEKT